MPHTFHTGKSITLKYNCRCRVNTNSIILGCFFGITSSANSYGFTGENGKYYEIQISDTTLLKAKDIIQDIINTYRWV